MIIRDLAGHHYIVTAIANIDHAWSGIPAKRQGGAWVAKSGAKARLVRKAGCVTVA